MKTYITLLFLLLSSASFSWPKPKQEYKILSVKNQTLYFKVNRSFVGGVVEVYDKNKIFMESEELPHTHTMIYFEEMPAGNYYVKVVKDNKVVELRYVNR
jgi:hypothetical protein